MIIYDMILIKLFIYSSITIYLQNLIKMPPKAKKDEVKEA